MGRFKYALLAALAGALFFVPARQAQAQIGFGVNIGAPPVCPYGYYDYAPYNCAPYGYYGPEWFNGGVFLGAGPWFHGPHDFYGRVDHGYDPHFGYRGGYPDHGGWHQPGDNFHGFHGNAMRDGRGHEQAFHGGGHH